MRNHIQNDFKKPTMEFGKKKLYLFLFLFMKILSLTCILIIFQSLFPIIQSYNLCFLQTIADCVESLIGTYLIHGGVEAGVKVLEWFKIIPEKVIDLVINGFCYYLKLPLSRYNNTTHQKLIISETFRNVNISTLRNSSLRELKDNSTLWW